MKNINQPFQVIKLNTRSDGTFVFIVNSNKILKNENGIKDVCLDNNQYTIEKDSWSLIVREIELTYDDKQNSIIFEGH